MKLRILGCGGSAVSWVEVGLVCCISVNWGRGLRHFGSREVGSRFSVGVEEREDNLGVANLSSRDRRVGNMFWGDSSMVVTGAGDGGIFAY